jgi:hypothetical protein
LTAPDGYEWVASGRVSKIGRGMVESLTATHLNSLMTDQRKAKNAQPHLRLPKQPPSA